MIDQEKQITAHPEYFSDKRKLEKGPATNLIMANDWLGGNENTLALFDQIAEKYKPTFREKLKGVRLSHEIICELITSIGWKVKHTQEKTEVVRDQIISKYEQAKAIGFGNEYAGDIAAIAEINNETVENVAKVVKKVKTDERAKIGLWATASSLTSAIFAEGGNYDLVVNTYIDIKKDLVLEDEKYDLGETVFASLTQAALLSNPETALARFRVLLKETIAHKPFSKKEIVARASKAFLVMAEAVGNLNPEQTIPMLRNIMTKGKLSQDAAVRLFLTNASQDSETPIMDRQGSFFVEHPSSGLKVGGAISSNGVSPVVIYDDAGDYTQHYAVALRLSNPNGKEKTSEK